jgi:hypothetical protein
VAKKSFLIALVGFCFAATALAMLLRVNDVSRYDFLKEPRLTSCPDSRMLVLETDGDAFAAVSKAVALFGKVWSRVHPGYAGPGRFPLFARWPRHDLPDRSTWSGWIGIPFPDAAARIPVSSDFRHPLAVQVWRKGPVAEILHIGPYSTVGEDVGRLKEFILEKGCRITGDLEEEYLRRPSPFGAGYPERYYTILRFPVEKKPVDSSAEEASQLP